MAKCLLCNSDKKDDIKYGEFIEKEGVAVHSYCLYLSSGLVQNGKDDNHFFGFLPKDIRSESQRVRQLNCHYCHKSYANIGCCESKCRRTFHLICGTENGCENQFVDTYRSYCHSHLRKEYRRPPAKDETCCICYERVLDKPRRSRFYDVIKAPCCRNGWFHKWCIQHFARSAGYFFKCPLCNDKNKFRQNLPYHGIFIPDRDAEWELEPNAFSDLLERPNSCNAEVCNNEQGREANTDTRNPLLYCNTCGSVAIHKHCQPNQTNQYTCNECQQVAVVAGSSNIDRDSGRESFETADEEGDEIVDVCNLSNDSGSESPFHTPIVKRSRSRIVFSDSSDDAEDVYHDTSDIDSPFWIGRRQKRNNILSEDGNESNMFSESKQVKENNNLTSDEDDNDNIINQQFNRNHRRRNVLNFDDETRQISSAHSVENENSKNCFRYESSDKEDNANIKLNSAPLKNDDNSSDASSTDLKQYKTKVSEILQRKRKINDSQSSTSSFAVTIEDSDDESDIDPLDDFDKALAKKAKLTGYKNNVEKISQLKNYENKTLRTTTPNHIQINSNFDHPINRKIMSRPSSCDSLSLILSESESSCSYETSQQSPCKSLDISCIANRTRHRKSIIYSDSSSEFVDSPRPRQDNTLKSKKTNILEISCVAKRTRRRQTLSGGNSQLSSIAEEMGPSTPNSDNTPKNIKKLQEFGQRSNSSPNNVSSYNSPYNFTKKRRHATRLISSSSDEDDNDAMKNR